MTPTSASAWDAASFRDDVQSALDRFVDDQAARLAPLGDDAARLRGGGACRRVGRQAVPRRVLPLGVPGGPPGRRGRGGAAPRRRGARAAARERAGARRLHGRLGHPAGPARHPQGVRGAAPRPRLVGRPRAVRRGRRDPARRPAAVLVRRAAARLRPAGRERRAGAGVLRHHPQRGDHRPVPRHVGAGARRVRRRAGDAGAALQVREVLRRAAAARRRRPRRRRPRGAARR